MKEVGKCKECGAEITRSTTFCRSCNKVSPEFVELSEDAPSSGKDKTWEEMKKTEDSGFSYSPLGSLQDNETTKPEPSPPSQSEPASDSNQHTVDEPEPPNEPQETSGEPEPESAVISETNPVKEPEKIAPLKPERTGKGKTPPHYQSRTSAKGSSPQSKKNPGGCGALIVLSLLIPSGIIFLSDYGHDHSITRLESYLANLEAIPISKETEMVQPEPGDSRIPTRIHFANGMDSSVRIHLVDYKGEKRFKFSLSGNHARDARTFVDQVWLVTDMQENPLMYFVPKKLPTGSIEWYAHITLAPNPSLK